jgi:hypothetical protein
MIIPRNLQQKNLSFFVSSDIESKMSDGSVKSLTSLKTLVPIGNSILGNSMPTTSFQEVDIDMIMDNEFYNIEIEFTVQET